MFNRRAGICGDHLESWVTGWLVGWAVRIRGKQSQNFPHALFRKKKKKQKNKKPKHSRSPVLFCFFFLCIFVFARQCHKFVDVCLTLKGSGSWWWASKGVRQLGGRWEAGARSCTQLYYAWPNRVENHGKITNRIQWTHLQMSAFYC